MSEEMQVNTQVNGELSDEIRHMVANEGHTKSSAGRELMRQGLEVRRNQRQRTDLWLLVAAAVASLIAFVSFLAWVLVGDVVQPWVIIALFIAVGIDSAYALRLSGRPGVTFYRSSNQ